MTAVAPPPNFQNISRQGWNGPNGVANGASAMTTDDYRQMFMPRKSVQRANSSSSLSSAASSSSTVSASSSQANGVGPSPQGEASTWARKKAPRGLWPASKTEPISGISTARSQPIASASSGPSAASAMTALHSPSPLVPSQHNGATQTAQNGVARPQGQESPAILHLIPINGTFERKTITVPFFPDVLRIGRQTNNKTIPTPLNGYFDSKVLSRQHAEIWADRNGKVWIRDVKSSNGTFVNGQRLSQENRDSDPHELREQDTLELGIDIVSEDQKTIVHRKVAARVEHAGIYSNAGTNIMDLNFGEIESPQLPNMMGPGGQQQLGNMRGRTPSQGSMNGGRMQGPGGAIPNSAGGMQQPRHPTFWLQPVTMEQVVKKLNAEMKAAKQQSQELQATHLYINSILTSDPKKEHVKPSPTTNVKISPIKDLKTRFSEPPAPPPQQPLPEKPDAHQPSLRRTDTERPGSSPIRESKTSSLTEALNSAKKEIETQSVRVRNLETLLNEERRARADAEERAERLERETSKDGESAEPILVNGDSQPEATSLELTENTGLENGSASPHLPEAATARLQARLETMMSEMNEMKQQMERYRQRAEDAEAESATTRKTLAEMVEKIRSDDAKGARSARRRSRSSSNSAQESTSPIVDGSADDEDAQEGEITIINEKDVEQNGPSALLQQTILQNGRPGSHEDKTSHALATRPTNRHDSAIPAMSMLTVVALGVAMMAYFNQYPHPER
ncbi:hypothetical protein K491DRAFT_592848 [Lophiostoma macrostomum CBS 122681]|uniref:FHA domain-containing protein n=1 Tax=Lophiostoma macrostomum CBS 122681 TaxID=1314788 RepID=A0A6A6TES1_9PLEO|nr:hypothetical protein K491DRAFT_592848 [Lophiostoma macrostomum CBS 122681]